MHWQKSLGILRDLIFAETTLDTFIAMIRYTPLGDIYPKSMWIGIRGNVRLHEPDYSCKNCKKCRVYICNKSRRKQQI